MIACRGESVVRIAVLGGGTGIYSVLAGLKHYPVALTAIVTMADDGGSSGRLRDEFGHLPPGDVRRCLLALSDEGSAHLLRRLFEYRFDRGNGLNGHSLGNLFLTALTEITGGTDRAIAEAARLLGVKGSVVPVTLSNIRLGAELADGRTIVGESQIDTRREYPPARITRLFLVPPAQASPAALSAIQEADLIVLGPGDLYTSVLPNLVVLGVPEALREARAPILYVCNLMTKHGETDGYRASEFVSEVQRYLGGGRPLDHVIVNDSSGLPGHLLLRYAAEGAYPVEADLERCKQLGPKVHYRPLAAAGSLLRHDPRQLATLILEIAHQHTRACR